MEEMTQIIIDCTTGEQVEKKLTKKELEQKEKDALEYEQLIAKEKETKELKISAYKKLGLTDEEIAAII